MTTFSAILPQMRTLPLIVTIIRYALESNGCRSSLIQSDKFSERPRIVPPEVYIPNVLERALSPKMENGLIDIYMLRIKRLFCLHQCPGNYQHFSCQLYSHFSFYPTLTLSTSKYLGKVGPE